MTNGINEIRLDNQTLTSGTSSNAIAFSTQSINGELLSIRYKTNSTGSIYLIQSGTNNMLWMNKTPSGTGINIAYPRVYPVDSANATGSPTHMIEAVFNEPFGIGISGTIAGSITDVCVRYNPLN